MKARVKATGEIVEVYQIDEITFKCANNGHLYCAEELEFLEPSEFTPDYWTRLEHTYAGMAMQGIVSSYEAMREISKERDIPQYVANMAFGLAHALVEKMKEERK